MQTTTKYARGTEWTRRYPWGINVSARAECPDGIVRRVARIAATADTFFSTPAAVKAYGKTVAGYLTIETVSGLSTPIESDPAIVRFVPFKYRKNHDVFNRKG